jgi:AraC-like DNA-binding protein
MAKGTFNQATLDRVGNAKDQINEAILSGDPVSVAHIAHALGCTAKTFRAEFISVTGVDVTTYIDQQRSNPKLAAILDVRLS